MQKNDIALTEIRPNDLEIMYAWENDPETSRLVGIYRPTHRTMFVTWFNNIGQDGSVMFAIRYTPEDKLIGIVHITSINNTHRSASIIIKIGNKEYRGKGYGRTALALVVNFSWADLNLHRLSLTVYHDNEPAIRAYKAVGFQLEGRLRQAIHVNGMRKDLLIMGLLRPDGQ